MYTDIKHKLNTEVRTNQYKSKFLLFCLSKIGTLAPSLRVLHKPLGWFRFDSLGFVAKSAGLKNCNFNILLKMFIFATPSD